MKKVLAALLSLMLVISASITAFGATKSDVQEKIKSSVSYALDENYGKDGYNVSNSKYFLHIRQWLGLPQKHPQTQYFSKTSDSIYFCLSHTA